MEKGGKACKLILLLTQKREKSRRESILVKVRSSIIILISNQPLFVIPRQVNINNSKGIKQTESLL